MGVQVNIQDEYDLLSTVEERRYSIDSITLTVVLLFGTYRSLCCTRTFDRCARVDE